MDNEVTQASKASECALAAGTRSRPLSIGFVVRTKNRNVLLKRALAGLAAQTYADCHVVIVNDGGDPVGAEQVCEPFFAIFGDRLTLVHHVEPVGRGGACNSGLRKLNTKLAVLHDDDDTVSPEFAARMVAVYTERKQQYPSIGGVACLCNKVWESIEEGVVRFKRQESFGGYRAEGLVPLDLMLQGNFIPVHCFVYELELCRSLGYYDDQLPVLEDWDFNLRFMLQHDIWMHPEILAFYHHRLNASGDIGNTVVTGLDQHKQQRRRMENQWLREDIKSGSFGLGSHICLQTAHQYSGRELLRMLFAKVLRKFVGY